MHIYPYIDVTLSSLGDVMSYNPIVHHEPSRDLPLKVFEAHPVVGRRILSLNIEADSDNEVSILVSGNTWNFRPLVV